jgi:hypothetical protein
MKSKMVGLAVVLMMALAAGCAKNAGPASTTADGSANASAAKVAAAPSGAEASIRSAIQARLEHQRNLNLQSFDTDVKQVNIQGDHAQAQVEFHIKGGPGVMQMTYALEKHDNVWSVVNSEPAGSNFPHPAVDGSAANSSNGPGAPGPVDPMSDPTKFFKSAAPAQPAPHR